MFDSIDHHLYSFVIWNFFLGASFSVFVVRHSDDEFHELESIYLHLLLLVWHCLSLNFVLSSHEICYYLRLLQLVVYYASIEAKVGEIVDSNIREVRLHCQSEPHIFQVVIMLSYCFCDEELFTLSFDESIVIDFPV